MQNYIISKQHYETLRDIKSINEKYGIRVAFINSNFKREICIDSKHIDSKQYNKDILEDLCRLKCINLYTNAFDIDNWDYQAVVTGEGKNQILKYKAQKSKENKEKRSNFIKLAISLIQIIKKFV